MEIDTLDVVTVPSLQYKTFPYQRNPPKKGNLYFMQVQTFKKY